MFINIGMVWILPVVVPPFVTASSSLISACIAIGILTNISNKRMMF